MRDGEAPLEWSVVLRHACSWCHLRFCDLADRIPPPLDYTQLPCMTSSQPFCTNTARSQQHHSNISVSFPPGNLPSLSRCLSCASKTERSNTCEAEYCFPLVVPHTHTHTHQQIPFWYNYHQLSMYDQQSCMHPSEQTRGSDRLYHGVVCTSKRKEEADKERWSHDEVLNVFDCFL